MTDTDAFFAVYGSEFEELEDEKGILLSYIYVIRASHSPWNSPFGQCFSKNRVFLYCLGL